MPAVILCELSWSCNSEMNSSMGEMFLMEEVNISSSLDGNISNCDLVRRVDDCELCTTIDYWLEGPIIFAVCLAGILGWWLWESASFMFMGLLWSHWCLQQPSEQKTKNLDYSQMNISSTTWVFLKNGKKRYVQKCITIFITRMTKAKAAHHWAHCVLIKGNHVQPMCFPEKSKSSFPFNSSKIHRY